MEILACQQTEEKKNGGKKKTVPRNPPFETHNDHSALRLDRRLFCVKRRNGFSTDNKPEKKRTKRGGRREKKERICG